jgi:Chaperone of endosialidase
VVGWQALSGALDQLLQLKGVTFEWKNPEEHLNRTGPQTGMIAQDVRKVFPQWVNETPDSKVLTVEPDARTVLALNVEAFRELKNKSDKQQAQIDKLQRQLDILTNGKDPISSGPGFGTGTLALMGLGLGGFAGASRLIRRKREEEFASK